MSVLMRAAGAFRGFGDLVAQLHAGRRRKSEERHSAEKRIKRPKLTFTICKLRKKQRKAKHIVLIP